MNAATISAKMKRSACTARCLTETPYTPFELRHQIRPPVVENAGLPAVNEPVRNNGQLQEVMRQLQPQPLPANTETLRQKINRLKAMGRGGKRTRRRKTRKSRK